MSKIFPKIYLKFDLKYFHSMALDDTNATMVWTKGS